MKLTEDLIASLVPYFNIMWAIMTFYFDYEIAASYKTIKKELLEEKLINKSDELLKLEADALIKQEKFKRAKTSLGTGKLGSYTQMDRIDKLSFINDLEENLNKGEGKSFGNAYDKLTVGEKKDFLMELRREILKDSNINVTLYKNGKRKTKRR